jgi:hypothetical protein
MAHEVLANQGDLALTERLLAEAERPVRAVGDRVLLSGYLRTAAQLALEQGDHPRALRLLHEALASAQAGLAFSLRTSGSLAWIAHVVGDQATARASVREAFTIARRTGEWGWAVRAVMAVAGMRTHAGALTLAARLFGASSDAGSLGRQFTPSERRRYEADVAAVRAGLGEEAYAAAWAAGRALTLEEAVDEAMAEDEAGDG